MLLGAELLALSAVLSTGLFAAAVVHTSTAGPDRRQPNPAAVDPLLARRRSTVPRSKRLVRHSSSQPSSLTPPRGLRTAESARGTSRTPSPIETDLADPSDRSADGDGGGPLSLSEDSPNTQLRLKLSHLFADDEEASENLMTLLGSHSRKSPRAPPIRRSYERAF